MTRATPILHRDDPGKAPLGGNVKVTRDDWLNIARDVLIQSGVADVKVLTLAGKLGVSRSSFYWYFENRDQLLDALLAEWAARNTAGLVAHCKRETATITEAVCNFFRCFLDPSHFDHGLDFAIREWARRDDALRGQVEKADRARLQAVRDMFLRFDYTAVDADARARILYFMQLGYHALEVREPMRVRLSRVGPYVEGFTGRPVDQAALQDFVAFVKALDLE